MDFLAFAAACGPSVHPLTTQAVVRAESGFDPLVIRNNTLGKTFHPRSPAEAKALATRFHADGHKLAIGLMQVTTPWFRRYAVTPAMLLDGCVNIRHGTAILTDNYTRFLPQSTGPDDALAKALSAYWSGKPDTGGAYVNHVYALAGSPARVAVTPGVTDGLLGWPANAGARPRPFAPPDPRATSPEPQVKSRLAPAARTSPLYFGGPNPHRFSAP